MRLGTATILVASVAATALLIVGGFAAIAFGVAGLLFFGSAALLPIALVGLIAFGSGLLFGFKIALPALRLVKED